MGVIDLPSRLINDLLQRIIDVSGKTSVVSSGSGSSTSSAASASATSGGGKMSAVVLVKKGGVAVMEAEKSLQSQVRVLTLGEGSPYEQLHDYVSAAVAPYFKSFVR